MSSFTSAFRYLTAAAAVLALGCSTPPATPATGTGNVTATDASGDGASSADSAGADTESGDTAAADVAQDADNTGDVAAVADGDSLVGADAVADTTGKDTVGDTSKPDAVSDIKDGGGTDVKPGDTVAATKCTAAADCVNYGFSECLIATCNQTTGACEMAKATDGKTCSITGPCGGTGVCKTGACAATSACGSQLCTPTPVKCGDKLVLEVASFGPSLLAKYGCGTTVWDGGEKVLSLSADATMVAIVSLSDDASPSATLLDLAAPNAGTCDPSVCVASGKSFKVGLHAGISHTIVVETIKADSGTVTLSIDCTAVNVCGDGTCSGAETQAGCPKDCGGVIPGATCGNGTCDPTEGCNTCPADCGACPKECIAKSSGDADAKGCPGCSCETCVCKGPNPGGSSSGDGYCCATAWDSICVGECTACGGPKCPTLKAICGDDDCGSGETTTNCPNDCPPASSCGDGICASANGESCVTCPVDCGACPPATAPKCGDNTCNGKEHCGSCPLDCGACDKQCAPQIGAGCPGCACEADVCDEIPECCDLAWDSLCVMVCAEVGKLKCPVDACGDGLCTGDEDTFSCKLDCGTCGNDTCDSGETASSCAKDCGCGNGECQAGETVTNCKKDCAFGCEGKCDSSSKDADGETCWCDSICAQQTPPDCCADKVQFCGK